MINYYNDNYGKNYQTDIGHFSVLFVVFTFLLFNPFLAVSLCAICSMFFGLNRISFFICLVVSLFFVFYCREFGVSFSSVANDDVPAYLSLFHESFNRSYFLIWQNFFIDIGNNEPIWHTYNWFVINFITQNDNVYIFITYVLIIFSFVFAIIKTETDDYPIKFIFIFMFSQGVLYQMAHIWRQQITFSLFILFIDYFLYNEKLKLKFVFLFTALLVFIHFSLIIYMSFFLLSYYISRNLDFYNVSARYKFLFVTICLSFFIAYLFKFFFSYVISTFYFSGSKYLESSVLNDSSKAVYVPFLLLMPLLKSIKTHHLFYCSLYFFVYIFSILNPNLSSIYARLFLFVTPLISICFCQSLMGLRNVNTRFIVVFILVVFFTCKFFYVDIENPEGVLEYLLNGRVGDPFSGVISNIYRFLI